MYDIIIAGAGIAGASIAYELANRHSVCILEAEPQPGMHATGRSAALFAPSYGGSEIRAVTRASRAFFDNPPPEFGDRPLLGQRGCLYPARGDQRERLGRTFDAVRASGGEVELIAPADAIALIPLLRESYVAAAMLDRGAMDIDVNALHQGFLRGARASGAVLRTGSRASKIQRRNGAWFIELGGDVIAAPTLVNAAGAWADQVAESCGARAMGLQPLRRTAMLVDVPENTDVRRWPAVIDVDEQFYFKPDAGKLLLSPADETPDQPGDAQPEELDIAIGVDRVQAALAIDVRRVSHSWAGLRTFAPDRVPVVGFDPDVPGLFWCAGQGGYGIQTAPAMARLSAALIQRQSTPPDLIGEGLCTENLSPFRFGRAAAAKRQRDA